MPDAGRAIWSILVLGEEKGKGEDARGERGVDNVQSLEITFVVMQEVVSCAITYMIHKMMCWK
jgi:hypothetical protein